MTDVLQLPAWETRVETGPVRFGNDWAGIFIRGDEAHYFAFMLSHILELLPKNGTIQMASAAAGVTRLAKLLASCSENPEIREAFERLGEPDTDEVNAAAEAEVIREQHESGLS